MPSYIVAQEITITRHEGDTTDIVFTVPAGFSLATYSTIRFGVKSHRSKDLAIDKSTDSGITVTDQTITIELNESDTLGLFRQRNRWEVQASGAGKVFTIGKGDFVITEQIV